MKDPYVYEDTNVLKNKLDIKDETTLKKAESDFVGFEPCPFSCCPEFGV